MTYKERLEFEKLQREIPELEKLKNELNDKVNAGGIAYAELNKAIDELTDVSKKLEERELRWLELSELVNS